MVTVLPFAVPSAVRPPATKPSTVAPTPIVTLFSVALPATLFAPTARPFTLPCTVRVLSFSSVASVSSFAKAAMALLSAFSPAPTVTPFPVFFVSSSTMTMYL